MPPQAKTQPGNRIRHYVIIAVNQLTILLSIKYSTQHFYKIEKTGLGI